MTLSPCVTKARLSVFRRATSATVPSATRSSRSRIAGSGAASLKRPRRRNSRSTATPSRNAIPTAARWPCAAPSTLSSSRLGLISATAVGSADGALVVVAHDHLEPGGGGFGERLERLRAAIDGDREARALGLQIDQRLAARAIAFHQPVGDVDHRLGAEPAQQQGQQGRRGRAVDVIVAEDGNRLAAHDGIGEPGRGRVHVGEHRRVGQEVAQGRGAVAREVARPRLRARAATGRRDREPSVSSLSRRARHGWPLNGSKRGVRGAHRCGLAMTARKESVRTAEKGIGNIPDSEIA